LSSESASVDEKIKKTPSPSFDRKSLSDAQVWTSPSSSPNDPPVKKSPAAEIDSRSISTKDIRAVLEAMPHVPSPATMNDVKRKSLTPLSEPPTRSDSPQAPVDEGKVKRAESERRLAGKVREALDKTRPDEALDLCDEWKRLNPRSAEAWYLSGRAHLLRGEAAPSEHHLNNAMKIAMSSASPVAHADDDEEEALTKQIGRELGKIKTMTGARDRCLEDLGKRCGASALGHVTRGKEVSPCNAQLCVLKAAAHLVAASSPNAPPDETQGSAPGMDSQSSLKSFQHELDVAFGLATDVLSQIGRPAAQYARVMHRSGLTTEADSLLEEVCNRTHRAEPLQVCVDLLRLFRSMESAKADANEAYNQGKYGESIRLFTRALELDPVNDVFNAIILSNRAAAHMSLGDYAKAVVDCDSALKLAPSFIKARLRRARALLKMNKFRESVSDYELAMRANPSTTIAEELAEARKAMKDHQESHRRSFFSRHSHSEPAGRTGSADDFGIPRMNSAGGGPLPRPGPPPGGYARRPAFSQQPPPEDLYKILGVSPQASSADIKKAYHRAALKHHPDKNVGDSEANQRFKKVLDAFHTLSDPQLRRRYDLSFSSVSVPMM